MIKLNLGSGPHALDGWINYDNIILHPSVRYLDLSKGKLPHFDNSVDYISTEHLCEHLTRAEWINILKECFRVLKPNGVIRIVTPDLDRIVQSYIDNKVPCMPGIWEPKTTCQMLNEGLSLWGHRFVYNKSEMTDILRECGFRAAWDCKKHISRHKELQGLEVRPEYFEMYIEAEK